MSAISLFNEHPSCLCTGCLPNEFQCNATTCIDGIKRCDRAPDCQDEEDELDCGMLI